MTILISYQKASEYCDRKECTSGDWTRLWAAARVLGVELPDVLDPAGNIDQRVARDDLGDWLRMLQLRYFNRDEVTTPNHRDKARRFGWEYLVPPVYLWPWLGLTLRVADILRESVGRSVRLRNAWRPHNYNEAVGGAEHSDHLDACGVDLDFSCHQDQRVAEGVLRSLYDREELQLSVGLGHRSLHVGVLSSRGRRRWFYKSASPEQRRGFRGKTYRTVGQ